MIRRNCNGRLVSDINWDSYNPDAFQKLSFELDNCCFQNLILEARILEDYSYDIDTAWINEYSPFLGCACNTYDIHANDIRDFFIYNCGYDMMLIGYDVNEYGNTRFYFTDVIRFEKYIKRLISSGIEYEDIQPNLDMAEYRITIEDLLD